MAARNLRGEGRSGYRVPTTENEAEISAASVKTTYFRPCSHHQMAANPCRFDPTLTILAENRAVSTIVNQNRAGFAPVSCRNHVWTRNFAPFFVRNGAADYHSRAYADTAKPSFHGVSVCFTLFHAVSSSFTASYRHTNRVISVSFVFHRSFISDFADLHGVSSILRCFTRFRATFALFCTAPLPRAVHVFDRRRAIGAQFRVNFLYALVTIPQPNRLPRLRQILTTAAPRPCKAITATAPIEHHFICRGETDFASNS